MRYHATRHLRRICFLAFLFLPPAIHAQPTSFIPLSPCRMADTRQPPSLPLQSGIETYFYLANACGIPFSPAVAAVSLNITIANIHSPAPPSQPAVLILERPIGTINPGGTMAWITYTANTIQLSNAGIAPTDDAGRISLTPRQGGGTVDVVIDVTGYFVYQTGP